jgi:hypothetical protein
MLSGVVGAAARALASGLIVLIAGPWAFAGPIEANGSITSASHGKQESKCFIAGQTVQS